MSNRAMHYSGWGQPTLDYFSMLSYYAQDRESTKVVKNYSPICYAVIPDVSIRFFVNSPDVFEVIKIFPGGETRKHYAASPRVVCSFRKIWQGKVKGWKASRVGDLITLTFKGHLIFLPYRVNVWRASQGG
jgi:hypothetical protein